MTPVLLAPRSIVRALRPATILWILCSIGRFEAAAQGPVIPAGVAELPVATKRFDLVLLSAFTSPDYRVRLFLWSSLSLAAGSAADPDLLGAALRDGATERERFLLPLIVACGPSRAGASAELDALLRRGDDSPLCETAALLALRRFSGGAVPPRAYESKEPAIAAAARFARPLAVDPAMQAWRDGRRAHARLVQRAEQLAAAPSAYRRELAQRIGAALADGDPAARALRHATAAWLATVPDPREWAAQVQIPHDEEVIALLATSPGWRETDILREAIAPPTDRVDVAFRPALILAFALTAAPQDFARARARWGRDGGDAAVLSLGVAWRLAREGTHGVPEWTDHLPDHPAREWIRVACGRPPQTRDRGAGDPVLDRLVATQDDARLVALGQELVADLTEDALLRAGAHLGALRRGLELDLILDLCVAGSTHAGAVLGAPADPRARYLPRGLPAGDETFEIAFEFLRFTRARAPTRLEVPRLR
ncbi:MAG: hypothetical protein HZB39_07195 [Planctomycetes bacterium]|nr:hypothetical protein [Planctomycetota bacterium]